MPYTLFFGSNSTKIEKCKKLQKSIPKRFLYGDSKRFIFVRSYNLKCPTHRYLL